MIPLARGGVVNGVIRGTDGMPAQDVVVTVQRDSGPGTRYGPITEVITGLQSAAGRLSGVRAATDESSEIDVSSISGY